MTMLTPISRTSFRGHICTSFVRQYSTTSSLKASWGFIGLGQMGYPMAKNLRARLPTADTLIVHDINENAARKLAAEYNLVNPAKEVDESRPSVVVADSLRQLAEQAETIITVLPETSHVEGVVKEMITGPLPPVSSGLKRLFIDCSTIDPYRSRSIASMVQDSGQGHFVDAPMSGGVVGARAATLTFMLGAPSTLLDRVRPILLLIGRSVHHCGEQGAGLSAKLANNYLLALLNVATAEAMHLGIRCGLDAKVLSDLINASTGRNWCSEVNNPVPGVVEGSPASNHYQGGFGVRLMKKDLKLAMAAAQSSGAQLQLDEPVLAVYAALESDERYKDSDFSVAYRYLNEK